MTVIQSLDPTHREMSIGIYKWHVFDTLLYHTEKRCRIEWGWTWTPQVRTTFENQMVPVLSLANDWITLYASLKIIPKLSARSPVVTQDGFPLYHLPVIPSVNGQGDIETSNLAIRGEALTHAAGFANALYQNCKDAVAILHNTSGEAPKAPTYSPVTVTMKKVKPADGPVAQLHYIGYEEGDIPSKTRHLSLDEKVRVPGGRTAYVKQLRFQDVGVQIPREGTGIILFPVHLVRKEQPNG